MQTVNYNPRKEDEKLETWWQDVKSMRFMGFGFDMHRQKHSQLHEDAFRYNWSRALRDPKYLIVFLLGIVFFISMVSVFILILINSI